MRNVAPSAEPLSVASPVQSSVTKAVALSKVRRSEPEPVLSVVRLSAVPATTNIAAADTDPTAPRAKFYNPIMKKLILKLKKAGVATALAAVALSLSSCAAGPYAKQGAVGGGVVGAAAGGIIGHQSGRGLEGAAVGGALGALAGALFGSAQDDVYGTAPQGGYQRPPAPAPPGPPRGNPPYGNQPPYGDRYIY